MSFSPVDLLFSPFSQLFSLESSHCGRPFPSSGQWCPAQVVCKYLRIVPLDQTRPALTFPFSDDTTHTEDRPPPRSINPSATKEEHLRGCSGLCHRPQVQEVHLPSFLHQRWLDTCLFFHGFHGSETRHSLSLHSLLRVSHRPKIKVSTGLCSSLEASGRNPPASSFKFG